MSSKLKDEMVAALHSASGSARRRPAAQRAEAPVAPKKPAKVLKTERAMAEKPVMVYQVAPSRIGTVPVTGHFPRQVRDQLKILAIEQATTLNDLQAEAYNDLFAKYGKAEIAPRQEASK